MGTCEKCVRLERELTRLQERCSSLESLIPRGNGSKSCFCPADFTPNPIMQRQAQITPGVDIDFELTQFKLHEFAQPKSDWDRPWIAWLNRAKPRKPDFDDVKRSTVSPEQSMHPALYAERNK